MLEFYVSYNQYLQLITFESQFIKKNFLWLPKNKIVLTQVAKLLAKKIGQWEATALDTD